MSAYRPWDVLPAWAAKKQERLAKIRETKAEPADPRECHRSPAATTPRNGGAAPPRDV